jgi:glycosyltransferase involved in cell wall biosynthesis
MEKIFFVIPIYNVEAYLNRCIDSVLGQSYQNTEIVLVDDGSPDRCPELCDVYAQKHKNITVIHKTNGGLSDARNAGIVYVKNHADPEDFLSFLDADDFIHKSYAERMVSLCKKYECDMAQCAHEKGADDTFGIGVTKIKTFHTSSETALLGYTLKSQCSPKICKVKIFNDILFPVGVLNEDEFVTYRVAYAASRIAFTNERLHYYFQHETSIMDDLAKRLKNNPHRYDFLNAYEERARFFEKENKPEQVLKTYEKVCTDLILRYCEQMYLPRSERDEDCINGKYMKLYRKYFDMMIKRKGMPLKRRLMYVCFFLCPCSAVLMGRIFTLRK